jgi:AcrR family transcriptional regulator
MSLQALQETSTRQLILDSARHEIDLNGIIGLRLSAVALRANVSVPLISRYFGGRDGLLAEVLGDWYAEFVQGYQSMVDSWLDSAEVVTLEQFAMLSPKPSNPVFRKAREFRLQVLATAVESPILRKRVSEITTQSHQWTLNTIRRGKSKLPMQDRNFDERIFSLLLFNTMYVFADFVEGASISEEEYSKFLVHLIRASARFNQ